MEKLYLQIGIQCARQKYIYICSDVTDNLKKN